MGRKPKELNPQTAVVDTALVQNDRAAADVIRNIEANYGEERDLANQLLGQIQMSRAISKFTDVVSLQKLKHIKETKMYRALAGKKGLDREGNEIPDVGTFDGFCRALGTSASKVDEDLANLKIFGEDALEQLTRIGAGYRELRQFRRLPEDQKVALLEAAKEGDKEAFLELAEDLIAKHAKEKAELEQHLQGKDAVLASKQKMIDNQAMEIDTLTAAAARVKTAAPDEALVQIRQELLSHAIEAEGVLVNKLRPAFQALTEHIETHGGECDEYLLGCLGQIERVVRDIREEFGLNQADVAAWAGQQS